MNTAQPLRALFVNENVGGHRTLHAHLRTALRGHDDVDATFLDVPPPSLLRKVVAAPVPGLRRLDLDLQPLRLQLAQSAHVRRRLGPLAADADAVHVYTHNAALLSAATLARVPTVVALDGTNEQNATTLPYRAATRWTPLTVALTRRFEQRVYDAATLLIAQSDWAARSLREDYGVSDERIRVVQYGMPVRRAPARVETERPMITFIGTSMERKGGWRLLDVWRRRLADRADLTLVTLEPVPAEPGFAVRTDVRPDDGQVEQILARTAVMAFPSMIDKSSFAVLEAMHAAVPVVSSSVGGMAEIVDDGVTGILVEPGDDDALADALAALVDDADRRRAMGDAARRRVETVFDARITTQVVLDVLREATERFEPRPQPA